MEVRFASFVPVQEKMQTTIDREMDFLYEVTTETGDESMLHLEFQTEDDEEMLYRIGEYRLYHFLDGFYFIFAPIKKINFNYASTSG